MSRLRANQITNENANGAPNFPHGLTVTGIITATNTQNTLVVNIVVGDQHVYSNSKWCRYSWYLTVMEYSKIKQIEALSHQTQRLQEVI